MMQEIVTTMYGVFTTTTVATNTISNVSIITAATGITVTTPAHIQCQISTLPLINIATPAYAKLHFEDAQLLPITPSFSNF